MNSRHVFRQFWGLVSMICVLTLVWGGYRLAEYREFLSTDVLLGGLSILGGGGVLLFLLLCALFSKLQHQNLPFLSGLSASKAGTEVDLSQSLDDLAEREQRLELALSGGDFGLWDWNIPSGQMTVNDRWATLMGFRISDITPHISFWTSRIHPDDKKHTFAALAPTINGQSVVKNAEFRLQCHDGSMRWFQARGRVSSWDDSGAPVRMTGILMDITIQKSMADKLRQSEKIVSASQDYMGLIDGNYVYRFVNPAYAAVFGDDVKIQGAQAGDIHSERIFNGLIRPHIDRCMAGEATCYQAWMDLPLPGRRFMDFSLFPYRNSEQKVTAVIFKGRDITETKRLEEMLVQAQKMEAIGTLASGIAHDFNNILSGIMGNAEILKYKFSLQGEAKVKIENILMAGLRARDVIQQILSISRSADVQRKPVQLECLVAECLGLLRASIPADIEIQSNVNQSVPAVSADPTQMHQVIINLCTNAYQSMKDTGGTLVVSLFPVSGEQEKGSLRPGNYLCLKIQDTGTGIPKEIIHKIFDPYFTTKPKDKGTGLGLAMTQRIVRNHGGSIVVDSEMGKGTAFQIYFPVLPDAEPDESTADMELHHGGETILWVDDEPNITETGRELLASLGYHVIVAGRADDALSMIRGGRHAVNVVITDYVMPDYNGLWLLNAVRDVDPAIPVVLCTGDTAVISSRQARLEGFDAVLMKPLTFKEMVTTIQQLAKKPSGA